MITRTLSGTIQGVDVETVEIEVSAYDKDTPEPLQEPHFTLIGLPDAAVRESRDRVRTALSMHGIPLPTGVTTVNLAPASLRKTGGLYDLAIALCLCAFRGHFPRQILEESMVVGELSLTGEIRPIRGALPLAMHAKSLGLKQMILPRENAREAAISGMRVFGVENLREARKLLASLEEAVPTQVKVEELFHDALREEPDFRDVKGQDSAKRALLIAAAGCHNVLMVGQPGVGKSLIANRIPGIMPPMTLEESMEVTRIYSIAGLLSQGEGLVVRRPFRSPHHTVSDAGLMGGGSGIPRPGEVTLAHRGVLFLDELPEFRRNTLEALRQPMENGVVTLARSSGSFTFPCRFMMVGAMNPCPCGYYGSPDHRCHCTPMQVAAYRGRLSGPMLDRFDLHLEVPPLPRELLLSPHQGPTSRELRAIVLEARARQRHRFQGTPVPDNGGIAGADLDRFCRLEESGRRYLEQALEARNLSARSYDRILRVARTCADLNGRETITEEELAEAIQYRAMDQNPLATPAW
ncbi:MAG: YifB family Mg chelatase-like AAA ATPase [Oligosphaeraceae bacterium]